MSLPVGENPGAPAEKAGEEAPVFHLHLVSDATGETVSQIARAALARFSDVTLREHIWTLVKTPDHLATVETALEKYGGVVLFSITREDLRSRLETLCRRLNIPAVSVLDAVLHTLSRRLGAPQTDASSTRHRIMDAAYFARIEALDFAIRHDDGQGLEKIDDADILLVGVSRSSKTPTSIYLAHRGYKVANYPLVPGIPMPLESLPQKDLFIVGLINDPRRLSQIRRARLASMGEDEQAGQDYADPDRIRSEITEARRLFSGHGWPVIDVTRRSVEEVAASVINLYNSWLEGKGA